MDVNALRILITLLSLAAFLGIVLWAWSGRQQQRFAEAASLPFADDDTHRQTVQSRGPGPQERSEETDHG